MSGRFRKRDVGLLALRALAGERVALLVGRRRYTLTVDPVFRIKDGADGFLYFCAGLNSLERRLRDLAESTGDEPREGSSKLGGAQGLL